MVKGAHGSLLLKSTRMEMHFRSELRANRKTPRVAMGELELVPVV